MWIIQLLIVELFTMFLYWKMNLENIRQNRECEWKVDETYIKIKGELHYLYRAIDKMVVQLKLCYLKGMIKFLQENYFRKL